MASAHSEPRTVLIVDDSALVRRVVREAIESSRDFRVAGEAGNGVDALRCVHELDPDLVTMDITMPGLGGLETLGCLMSEFPRPVVMLSGAESAAGAELTIRALELGAVDFVRKPSSADTLDETTLHRRLLQALRAAAGVRVAPPVSDGQATRAWRKPREQVPPQRAAAGAGKEPASHVIVIAASTGGPRTLAELVPQLILPEGTAVVIVQHMPEQFITSLAARLSELGPRPVVETVDEAPLMAGAIYLARGGRHTRIVRSEGGARHLVYDFADPVHAVRPAADPLFESAAEAFGAEVTAVVLTGMGRDGAEGCREIRRQGGLVIVQDPATCVVGGMGASVLAISGADVVSALSGIPLALASRVTAGVMPPSMTGTVRDAHRGPVVL
jgi:two-component system chemotaxis response regulator CheB